MATALRRSPTHHLLHVGRRVGRGAARGAATVRGPAAAASLLHVCVNLLLYQLLRNLHRLRRAGDAAGAVVRAGEELLRAAATGRQLVKWAQTNRQIRWAPAAGGCGGPQPHTTNTMLRLLACTHASRGTPGKPPRCSLTPFLLMRMLTPSSSLIWLITAPCTCKVKGQGPGGWWTVRMHTAGQRSTTEHTARSAAAS